MPMLSLKLARVSCVLVFLLAVGQATHASVSGPYAPTICVNNISIGSASWNFPSRAEVSDDLRTVKSISHQATNFLVCTGFNFSVPDTDLISGIVVENEVSVGGVGEMIYDHAQRIVRAGTIGAAERASSSPWPQVEAILAHGSSSDLWEECWCAQSKGVGCPNSECGNVNNVDFGAALSASHSSGSGGTARVDQVRITIYHGPPTPTRTVTPTLTITPTLSVTPTPTLTLTPTITLTVPPSATPTQTQPPTPTASIAVCPASPALGCAVPGKARIRLTGNSNPLKRKFQWSWQRGTIGLSELGNPLQGTSYVLCLYDDDELVADLLLLPTDMCGASSCWKEARRRGWTYRNRVTNPKGIAALTLRAGAGFAALELKAKRDNLFLPMPLRQTTTVTVQLIKDVASGLECWTSRFSRPAKRSSLDGFYDALPE